MLTDSPLGEPAESESPSLLAANGYLALGLIVLIVSSLPETNTLTRYGIGIGVEVALAALAFLFMRMERLPVVATARLRKPKLREVGLALLALPGLWISGVLLNLLSSLILGYTTSVPPSQYPRTILDAIALAATTMVAAPLCEELMFRGYIQRAYERRNAWLGSVISGIIFTLYHLRFQGAPALLPVAIALSLIAWRTNSIIPGIVLHAAYNAIATVLMIALSFLPVQVTGALTATFVFLAILATPVSVAALWLLWQGTTPAPRLPATKPRPWQRWIGLVPVTGLIAVYGYAAATEIVVGAFPQLISTGPIRLEAASADREDTITWHYSIQNNLGQDLGEAICTKTSDDQDVTLACDADYEGYDLTHNVSTIGMDPDKLPRSLQAVTQLLQIEPKSWSLAASWTNDTSELLSLDITESTPIMDESQLRYRIEAGNPNISAGESGAVSDLSKADSGKLLLPYEWAWRLSAIPFEVAYIADATIVQQDQEGKVELYPVLVNVVGGEPTWTPAGTFVAWKVTVTWEDEDGQDQQQVAWYDSDAPHALVSFRDGNVTYALKVAETPGEGTK